MNAKQRKQQNLVEVKQALADKYIRLARVAKSEAKKQHYLYRAARYRRQAEHLHCLMQSGN